MDNRRPMQFPQPVRAPASINSLPTEVLHIIAQHLAVEPDVTTGDQTGLRRRNPCPLCLVCRRFCPTAVRALYEFVHITGTKQLELFFNTVESQPELGQVLNTTTRLKSLSLDLKECTKCFRNSGPEDIAAGRPNDGYDTFYKRVRARIGNDLKTKRQTFLPVLEEFCFTSNGIPYMHCVFFALPSLRSVISMRDTGAWSMILASDYDIGTQNPHIKKLSLRSSALIPSEADVIRRSFPNLEEFEFSTNAQEMNCQVFPGGLTEVNPDRLNLSATLAKMQHLCSLALGLHFRRAPALARINFPMHLGPAGGITSLGGLRNLTYLQIGMHHLMCYRGENSQPQAEPLPPSVLPPNLEHLQLNTCLSCWDNQIAALSRDAWQQTLPSYAAGATLTFVKYLAAYVSAGSGLPGLRDVRLYSQTAWWLAHRVDYRTVRHCKEEEGQIWNAGGFEEFCGISRFENRTPRIHFRAYETGEYGCDQHQPYDDQ
ncbi:hypothetical protein INS49_003844 [Diaporthe citri]|uniref:uncharacterized protein n=1 Tax=Diaporthe citri TaxID=83186 RepID=UPI001C7F6421|nr:uncharacterized protein INS49_003844 [Diaporthe citri]KAG6354763.1 hypothetical protein INS49_003844 [Diaporthe citri]